MTSPSHSPAAFHARPICETLQLPVVRHLAYRCNRCSMDFPAWRSACTCGSTARLLIVEIDDAAFARLQARCA